MRGGDIRGNVIEGIGFRFSFILINYVVLGKLFMFCEFYFFIC